MIPNEVWKNILNKAKQIDDRIEAGLEIEFNDISCLSADILQLNNWIEKGGYLPDALNVACSICTRCLKNDC